MKVTVRLNNGGGDESDGAGSLPARVSPDPTTVQGCARATRTRPSTPLYVSTTWSPPPSAVAPRGRKRSPPPAAVALLDRWARGTTRLADVGTVAPKDQRERCAIVVADVPPDRPRGRRCRHPQGRRRGQSGRPADVGAIAPVDVGTACVAVPADVGVIAPANTGGVGAAVPAGVGVVAWGPRSASRRSRRRRSALSPDG